MAEKEQRDVIKMQKLRRVIERLRNVRSQGEPEVRKKSWLARLKARLGWGGEDGAPKET